MLWTSIPTNFTGSARPLKPRSGAVAIARSMPSSCVASVPAFLSTRPEGPELSLQQRTAAARTAAAMGRREFTWTIVLRRFKIFKRPFGMTTLPVLLVALLQGPSLGTTVDSLAAAQQFSGVVLIARGGSPVVEKAYGTGNNIETAFNRGSINKLFTQIAIRQLAAQGKINLDST